MDIFPKKEIEDLLKRIKNGDQSAFNRLIDLKSKNLQRLAYSYLHDEYLAEDVVSDVFYELIKKCGQFKNDKNLNGWLNVTAINKSLNIIQKRRKETSIEDLKEQLCITDKDEIEQIHIRECLALLNEDERQAIIYRYEGYTLKEIRKMMNLTINELLGLLERAKRKFKKFYES